MQKQLAHPSCKSGGGQILICVVGRGFYQEEGKGAIEMKPGDCISIRTRSKTLAWSSTR